MQGRPSGGRATIARTAALAAWLLAPGLADAAFVSQLRIGVADLATGEALETLLTGQASGAATESYAVRTDQYGQPYSARSSGSFDLASGEARFYLDAAGYEAVADAGFFFFDDIAPYWLDPTRTDPIKVTVTWLAEGSYSFSGSSLKNLSLYAWFAQATDSQSVSYHSLNQYNLTDGRESFEWTTTFVPGVNQYLRVGQVLRGSIDPYNGQTATADFSNTSTIRIDLSPGAGFTSASGTLLTAVPVPAALPLLTGAMAALALVRHRAGRGR